MKIQVQLIVNGEAGRKAWIVRNPEGQLAVGTIYVDELTATNLTPEEVDQVCLKAAEGAYVVLRIAELERE